MYTLLSGLWKYMFQKDEYYILILGLDNAGKTTLLERFKQMYNIEYKGIPLNKIHSTVGLNVARVDVTNKIKLVFWDLGGQSSLHSLWSKYYEEAHGIIYVVDSTDVDRMTQSQVSFDAVVSDAQLESVPVLLLANKQDVEGCYSVTQIKDIFNQSARSVGVRDCKVEPVSAVNGDGIKHGLEWLVHSVAKNIHRPPKRREIS